MEQLLTSHPDDADVMVAAAWSDEEERANRAALTKSPDNVELLLLAAELAARESDVIAASTLVGPSPRGA